MPINHEVEKVVEKLKQVSFDDGIDYAIKKRMTKETEKGIEVTYEIQTKYVLLDPSLENLDLIKRAIETIEEKYSGLIFDFIDINYNEYLPSLEVTKINRTNDFIKTTIKVTYYEQDSTDY